MNAKIFTIVKLSLLGGLIFAAQACFESQPYPVYGGGYGGGYGGPAYYARGYDAPPVVVGDYDDHHAWHDRSWWVGHDRGWVQVHHQEWLHHDDHGHHDHDDHH